MDNHSVAAESFQTPIPLPKWSIVGNGNASSENNDGEADKSWNCFGVVHVRLLSAQRLPCPVGSSVSATVSLLPWRGRVRTSVVAAFSMAMDHGVCVAWDPTTDQGVCSMVHAWSSEDSPVPDIKIELNFSPLGLGLFEFKMASLILACEVLFRSPGKWKRQWCETEQDEAAKRDATGLGPILIQLEAIFIPGPVNTNAYLPDPDLLENHIGYVDNKEENTVSRMSDVDHTSIESIEEGINDESMIMDDEEADQSEIVEEAHLDLTQQSVNPLGPAETTRLSQEEQLNVSCDTNLVSNIQEAQDLPGAVPTEDSIVDQEQETKKQTNDTSIHVAIADPIPSDVVDANQATSSPNKNDSLTDEFPDQEQIELPESATAADLLSILLNSSQEHAGQDRNDSPAPRTPMSKATPPTKPVPLKKESDLTTTTNLSPSQEQIAMESITTEGPVLDQEQAEKQPNSKPVAVEKDSDLTPPVNHNLSQGEMDRASRDTVPLDEVLRAKKNIPPITSPTSAFSTKSATATPISGQEPVNREQELAPKKPISVTNPTRPIPKQQDSDPPKHVATTKVSQRNQAQDGDRPPHSPMLKANPTTPIRKKNPDLPKFITPTKRSSKNMTPTRVQVDMSAVVKAAKSPPTGSVASHHDGASVSMISTANNTVYSTQHGTHLLRVANYWVPSKCAVCEKVLFGRKSGSECEVCHVECCPDCRLNVDVRVPCAPGSSHSKKKKASIESLLSFVAPDETFERNRKSLMEETIDEGTVFNEEDLDFSTGIGYLKLSFLQAAIFKQPLPSDEYPDKVFAVHQKEKLFLGDYYARVSISDSTRTGRTPTVQKSGLPQFRSNQLFFGIEDYGREFRLDIIDSNTDSVVGSATLTTQGILQRQRDEAIQREGVSLFQFAKGPIKANGSQEIKIMLRSDAKNGLFATKERSSEKKTTCIIGWLEIQVGIEEYTEKLLSNEFDCPKRVHPKFRMSNLQDQLQRLKFLLEDAKSVIDGVKYIVSWENPFITAAALYIHVVSCTRFNSEYGGSVPFVIIICWMLHARNRRYSIPTAEEEEKVIPNSSDEKDHDTISKAIETRSFGSVTVDVTKGADLLSRDGIPGRVSCHVVWDPTKFATKQVKKAMKKLDKASRSSFEIGHTDTRYSAQPTWELSDSHWNKRLKGLVPPEESFSTSEKKGAPVGLSFPVLQPLDTNTVGPDGESSEIRLASWDKCTGAVVFQVYFSDVLLGLGVEYEIGQVAVKFSELLLKRRISGWFEVSSGAQDHVVSVAADDVDSKNQGMKPRIHITLSWQPPGGDESIIKDTSRDLSIAIQEELSQFSHSKRTNIIDSSLEAVNTALGLGGNLQDVQNSLISILDLVESIVNLLNFTDPFKSSLVFWAVVAACVVFLIIPTRLIVFVAGMGIFWATFDQRYGITKMKIFKRKVGDTPKPTKDIEMKENKGDTGNIFMNAIRSLPTREDLRKASYWEKLRVDHTLAERRESKKRDARLKKLWKSQWFANAKLKEQSDKDREFLWVPVFAVVQGHFFLWWDHARDFDKGEEPAGKVYLSGHAGLTGPSPLEMRELSADDLSCFVGIFGRGSEGQERISILTESSQLKSSLEDAILHLEEKND